MNPPDPLPSGITRARTAGPQGTQLLSAEELKEYTSESEQWANERASTHKPVLQGVGAATEDKRFVLRSGRQTVGRRGDNDIVVDEPSVSASHAWIINQHGHYVIMNTLSTNGTFVNDKRIHEAVLKHGDRVRLGQAEFVFLTREPGASSIGWVLRVAIAVVVVAAVAVAALWLMR
ncbi:FHA domain-containing protein [Dyella sp.]|uniref:FHA domain-containing protein n=1 Tax=Dyella sp. TaxID=1869338 RepID=UPI002ED21945